MKLIIGVLVVMASVLGGFVLSKGHIAVLFQPVEVMIILGASLGAMVIATPIKTITRIFTIIYRLITGHQIQDKVIDTLLLLYELFNTGRKEGMMALEQEIEDTSLGLFAKHPMVIEDENLTTFIVDYVRMMMSGSMNSFEVEALMDIDIEARQESNLAPAEAIFTLAEGLPAFGIVAAVLGVVITMSSLGGPMEETGMHVAHALVGTMLGILMAYGFASPLAHAMERLLQEEDYILTSVKTSILACLSGYAPQLCIEFGRISLPPEVRPDFNDMDLAIKKLRGR